MGCADTCWAAPIAYDDTYTETPRITPPFAPVPSQVQRWLRLRRYALAWTDIRASLALLEAAICDSRLSLGLRPRPAIS